jgi:hypothetical protein
MGPATKPWSTRNKINISMDDAKPHNQLLSTNNTMLLVNKRTAPKRWVSQPVSGTEMALATPKLVITQVPWLGLTPKSPEIAGIDTLAIEESNTFINVAKDSDKVPNTKAAPLNGWSLAGAVGAEGAAGAVVLMALCYFVPYWQQ